MEREEDARSKQFARPDQDVKVRPRGCFGGGKLKHKVGCWDFSRQRGLPVWRTLKSVA